MLHWIFSNKPLKQFVANRVQVIHDLFPASSWSYCHTTENAADLLTRGITHTQLKSSQLWFQGPPWLTFESNWPTWSPACIHHIQATEEAEIATLEEEQNTIQPSISQVIDISRHNKLTKLLRVTAYVLRFIDNIKNQSQKNTEPLTVSEIDRAQRLWIQSAQQQIFSNEMINLKSKSECTSFASNSIMKVLSFVEEEFTMPQCPTQQSFHTCYHGDIRSQTLLFMIPTKNTFMQEPTVL